jgi:hypothetical protein
LFGKIKKIKMKDKIITYNPEGRGEDYGVQYHGENLIQFLKAIHYLVLEKKMNMPLPSHHGFSFKLTKFNLYLDFLNGNWTHKTKGNGNAPIRLVLGSSKWVYTIDEHGNSIYTDRALLNDKTNSGFIKAMERAGFTIENSQKGGYFAFTLKDNVYFVAKILPPQNETGKYQPDISNPDYQKVFDDFLTELTKVFEYNSVIS